MKKIFACEKWDYKKVLRETNFFFLIKIAKDLSCWLSAAQSWMPQFTL